MLILPVAEYYALITAWLPFFAYAVDGSAMGISIRNVQQPGIEACPVLATDFYPLGFRDDFEARHKPIQIIDGNGRNSTAY